MLLKARGGTEKLLLLFKNKYDLKPAQTGLVLLDKTQICCDEDVWGDLMQDADGQVKVVIWAAVALIAQTQPHISVVQLDMSQSHNRTALQSVCCTVSRK